MKMMMILIASAIAGAGLTLSTPIETSGKYLEIPGASIYYESYGEGHPLILIAGFTQGHASWEPILLDLTTRFRVILFDNRGAGKTKDSKEHISAETIADDIYQLIQALGLKKPHIIGHSMGGSIAQTFAAKYPESIGKLGLIATSAKWQEITLAATFNLINLRESGVKPELLFDTLAPWTYSNAFLSNKQTMQKEKLFALTSLQSLEDEKRQAELIALFDGRGQLKKIQAPTLVMYGVQDLIAPPSNAEFLVSHIANAKMLSFNSGHAIMVEKPHKLSTAIINFFADDSHQ